MSFILDALRKSEHERQREAAPSLSRAPTASVRHRVPAWTWVLIGGLSIALLALAAAFWRNDQISEPTVTATPLLPEATESVAIDLQPAPLPVEPLAAASLAIRPIRDLASIDPSLPDYRLELLAYNGRDPAASSAWINGRRYYVGDPIGDGPVLVEVRPDGVVMAHLGQEFLLTTR